MIVWY